MQHPHSVTDNAISSAVNPYGAVLYDQQFHSNQFENRSIDYNHRGTFSPRSFSAMESVDVDYAEADQRNKEDVLLAETLGLGIDSLPSYKTHPVKDEAGLLAMAIDFFEREDALNKLSAESGTFLPDIGLFLGYNHLISLSTSANKSLIRRGLGEKRAPMDLAAQKEYVEPEQFFLIPVRNILEVEKPKRLTEERVDRLIQQQQNLEQKLNKLFPPIYNEKGKRVAQAEGRNGAATLKKLWEQNGKDSNVLSTKQFEDVAYQVYEDTEILRKKFNETIQQIKDAKKEAEKNFDEQRRYVILRVLDKYFIMEAHEQITKMEEVLIWLKKARDLILQLEAAGIK